MSRERSIMKKIGKTLKSACVLGLSGALLVCSVGCSSSSESSGGEKTGKKQLVSWDKSEYVTAYNDMMKEKVDEFAEKYDVDVDYVIVNSGDLEQKLAAAIESGNQPDIIMGDNTSVAEYIASDQLAEVSDVLADIDLKEEAKPYAVFNDTEYLVPLSLTAPGMFARQDVWEEHGLEAPKTWEELKEQAKIINDPDNGFYALGLPLGESGGGDAETFIRTIILDYGGEVVNAEGEVTVNSPEVLEAFKFIASLYEEGLVPPDATTWDDSGNNSAYTAGTVGVVFNSGSLMGTLKDEYPEIWDNTAIFDYPAAEEGGQSYTLGGANVFGIFKTGDNTETAKEFISYFFSDTDFYNEMVEAIGGMWQPVINGYDDTEFWQDPDNAVWLTAASNLTLTTAPAPTTDTAAQGFSNHLCTKALQNIVVNGMDPQEALDGLEADLNELYQ